MSKPKISKVKQKEIAKERINTLFNQAKDIFSENRSLSDRYVFLARKIAMKSKVRIPKEFKLRFCKHCYKYLMPGNNCRIRKQPGKIIISCLECKKFMRIPVLKKRKVISKNKTQKKKIKKSSK
ncbi:ribonuclease P [archaeon]|jgi:ribonuclease P protein subunit RPR2|nr:ribonuclease P [archaeon]MBT3451174.1 ribonuclease P [archaeon]MBT6869708.1 ribonuclease P [archaeon]MBT7192637.1 ribonuclease P [archaeon]MBT7380522.1 ribonuclease P [archaeon]